MLVFLSGPYTTKEFRGVEKNVWNARQAAIELWSRGIPTICPHLNTQNFDKETSIPERVFYNGYCKMIKHCTHVVMLPNWKKSKGAVLEEGTARMEKVPVYYSLAEFLKVWNEGDAK